MATVHPQEAPARSMVTSQVNTVVMTPPERPRPDAVHHAMLSFARCLGARDRQEVYVSTPITTGAAYVTWRNNVGNHLDRSHPKYRDQHREHVIDKNIARIRPVISGLRRHFHGQLVVDPTSLPDVDDWEQHDYHAFWCALIEQYIRTAVFTDGWQFSTGCVREFATAIKAGVWILQEDLAPLTIPTGLQLVRDAIRKFEELGVDAETLRSALASAEQAAQNPGKHL